MPIFASTPVLFSAARMLRMRSYACTLGLLALCVASLSGCGSDGDYQVAVSWLINGSTPPAAMCQEQGIARARFEVRSAGGQKVKTVEGNCADTIKLSDTYAYGGFYTNTSFNWGTTYDYSLTLVDALGNPVSIAASSSFGLDWNRADVYELNYLDYVNPNGRSASLTAEWSFANGTAESVAADCAAQRVTKVRVFATSALDDPNTLADAVQVAEADCSAGRFVSNGAVLATGDYLFFLQAISDAGAVVTTSAPQGFFVDFNQSIVLMRASFFSK